MTTGITTSNPQQITLRGDREFFDRLSLAASQLALTNGPRVFTVHVPDGGKRKITLNLIVTDGGTV